jgi:hypothetical protein
MPNRILRDGILSSERIAMLSWAEEVFYRRLLSVADDHGRFHASPKLIRSACYPLQFEKVSDADIGKWTTACVAADLVSVYPAQDGKRYIQILRFGQQVRAKSKFPDPLEGGCEQLLATDIRCDQVPANAHLVVVEDEDVKHTSADASLPSRFQDFWEAWPSTDRRVAKAKCQEKWLARKLDRVADQIVAHVEAMKTSKSWKDGFEPAPLTYINQSRWEDGTPADGGKSDMFEGAI